MAEFLYCRLLKSVREAETREPNGPRPLTRFLWLQLRADPDSASRPFIRSQSRPRPISRCNQRFLVPSPSPGLPIGLEPDAIIISACNEKLQIWPHSNLQSKLFKRARSTAEISAAFFSFCSVCARARVCVWCVKRMLMHEIIKGRDGNVF